MMKPADWHQLWVNWKKENLIERWEQDKIVVMLATGRLIAWVDFILRGLQATQDEMHRAASLATRVEVLERRMAVMEKERAANSRQGGMA